MEQLLCGGHFRAGQKRGAAVGKTKRGKGTKLMVLANGAGAPPGVLVEAASPAEVKLLEPTLENFDQAELHGQPERLIADKGYDGNAARELLVKRDIEMIIAARKNNRKATHRKATHQDGRKMRRYKHRWIIERTNVWLQNFRRLAVRYESCVVVFTAMVQLACALICLNRILG
jgi:transposase